MMLRWLVAVPLCVAIGLGITSLAQRQIDAGRAREFDEELLYLPNERLLNHFTGGMSSVIADLLWLKCIQYTSEHFKGDGKFVWLDHMCTTITRLDPYYVDVYRNGGIFLAALEADDDASIRLMRRGIRHNPNAWELPYEIAMVYLLNRRDEPRSAEYAAMYLSMAVATGNAPDFVHDVAQGLQMKHDLDDIERGMWRELLETSEDQFQKDIARQKLQELTIRENCELLTEAVERFQARTGALPESLEDLARSGIVTQLPDVQDPLGGRYFISQDGKVKNTTLLDNLVQRRAERLRMVIDAFHEEEGRWPASLDELIERDYAKALPSHPYPGETWQYDPETGEVE